MLSVIRVCSFVFFFFTMTMNADGLIWCVALKDSHLENSKTFPIFKIFQVEFLQFKHKILQF